MVQLRLHKLQLKVQAAMPLQVSTFPSVRGRDDSCIVNYLRVSATEKAMVTEIFMGHPGKSLLAGASAIALSRGSGGATSRAMLATGLALLAVVRAGGERAENSAEAGETSAKSGVVPEAADEDFAAPVTREAGGARAGVEASMFVSKDEGMQHLREALNIAIRERDFQLARAAALGLVDAFDAVDVEEAAEMLILYHTCSMHSRLHTTWLSACAPTERFGLLARMTDWLKDRWPELGAVPAAKSGAMSPNVAADVIRAELT